MELEWEHGERTGISVSQRKQMMERDAAEGRARFESLLPELLRRCFHSHSHSINSNEVLRPVIVIS
jgi:hypothetical protein